MIDFSIYSDRRAVRALRLAFVITVSFVHGALFMPGLDWVPTFLGMLLMCHPYTAADYLDEKILPAARSSRVWRTLATRVRSIDAAIRRAGHA